jgi:caffeoyl-CoA O-methyltransferase
MFHPIPGSLLKRMSHLEAIDRQDRRDGSPRSKRLRQVPPQTGRFLALLAASAPAGQMIEIGTSAGYSTMWLALACRETGRRLTTFEVLPEKVALARETFRETGLEERVNLVEGDARELITGYSNIAFCFLDAEKEVYADCYELVVTRLVKGGLLVADNAISHEDELAPMLKRALSDERVDSLLVPLGTGELVCRRV